MDVEVAAECGAYTYANDAAITGAMTAAHATLARVDILWMRVDDPPEDGTAVPAVVGGYTAGAAASTPAPPATPARCMVLGWVNVPASGGGAPTVTWVAPYMVAAGGAGAPTTYTPTLIATTTNPTNYVGTGRYIQVGKQVTFWFNITMSAGFTAGGGTYNISLPVTKANASNLSISGAGCMLYDSSASLPNYGVSPTVGSAGNVNYAAFQCLAAGILAAVTSAAPWVWAPNDQISGCLIYEGV